MTAAEIILGAFPELRADAAFKRAARRRADSWDLLCWACIFFTTGVAAGIALAAALRV